MDYTRGTIAGVMWFACGAVLAAEATEGTDLSLQTPLSKASYAFGMDVGNAMRGMAEELDFEIDVQALVKGLEDTIRNRKTILTVEEARVAKVEVIGPAKKLRLERGERNKKAGEGFLAANKAKEGIVSTASGLQYAVLNPGVGPNPGNVDRLRVHYRGTLLDGTEILNTRARAEPETVVLGKVLPGLAEALREMPVGAVWRVFVPPQLGYGARGRGKAIPPHATLIFEIELLAVEPEKGPAEEKPASEKKPQLQVLPVDDEGKAPAPSAAPQTRAGRRATVLSSFFLFCSRVGVTAGLTPRRVPIAAEASLYRGEPKTLPLMCTGISGRLGSSYAPAMDAGTPENGLTRDASPFLSCPRHSANGSARPGLLASGTIHGSGIQRWRGSILGGVVQLDAFGAKALLWRHMRERTVTVCAPMTPECGEGRCKEGSKL